MALHLIEIEKEFKNKVCDEIHLFQEGVNRFKVFTPFSFEDGDRFSIIIKNTNGKWFLSDEGHTLMHLSYEIDEKDYKSGNRDKIISNIISSYSLSDNSGELIMPVVDNDFGDALYSFIQALVRISDVTYLNREIVLSTFLDDFKNFIGGIVPADRLSLEWFNEEHDPHGMYQVDCRVNGMEKPLFIYGLNNDDKVRDSTIALHQFERWGLSFRAIGVFEDQENINRKVLARFSDVCDKQFSNIATNKERMHKYIAEEASLIM